MRAAQSAGEAVAGAPAGSAAAGRAGGRCCPTWTSSRPACSARPVHTAATMCRSLVLDRLEPVATAVPILTNILQYPVRAPRTQVAP